MIKRNACTQATIRFFNSEMQNFENCTQTAIRFSQRNKKFRIVPKLSFILWLQNTKFLKLFPNSQLLFDNKLKNESCIQIAIRFLTKEYKIWGHTQTAIRFFTKNNKNRTLVLTLALLLP